MSKTTIDIGIDLVTTNSAIAVTNDGNITIVRNNWNQEITPSCVRVSQGGAITVGKLARDRQPDDSGNTFSEFKRLMGTQQVLATEKGGLTFSPEALSAEVLKILRHDVERSGGGDVTSAVITVPALFELAQCEATQQAARLAGITHAPLLQEPVAAAYAYGMQADRGRTYWLVYDLGGGTFDTSIVSSHEGQMRVVEHSGDNFLGGKDFDDALVDDLLVRLKREFNLSDPSWERPKSIMRSKLRRIAEDAKIELSQISQVEIEINNIGFDSDGRNIETVITITRHELEKMIMPRIVKSINIVRSSLIAASLEPSALEKVILVGGPTKMPIIRSVLENELRVPLETRIDAMTVVVHGAAMYAGTQRRESVARVTSMPGAVNLNVVHDMVAVDDRAFVAIAVDQGAITVGGFTITIEREDGGWASSKEAVRDGRVDMWLTLRERSVNHFRIRLLNGQGSMVAVQPDRFTISHGLAEITMTLTRALGVAAIDRANAPETRMLLPKGAPLPARKTQEFRTKATVRAGTEEKFEVKFVEGEHHVPERNRHVGSVVVRGGRFSRDLPADSVIEVTLEISEGRNLRADVFIPFLDLTVSEVLEQRYAPVPLIEDMLIRLSETEERARQAGADVGSPLAEVRGIVKAAKQGDQDAAENAARRLQEIGAMLDEIELADMLPKLKDEFDRACRGVEQSLNSANPAERRRFEVLRSEGRAAVDRDDVTIIQARTSELRQLEFDIDSRHPNFWLRALEIAEQQEALSNNPQRQRELARAARAALQGGNLEAGKRAISEIFSLLPNSPDSPLPDIRTG